MQLELRKSANEQALSIYNRCSSMALVIKKKCKSVRGADLRRFTRYDLRDCTILCMEGLNSWVPALVCAVVSVVTFSMSILHGIFTTRRFLKQVRMACWYSSSRLYIPASLVGHRKVMSLPFYSPLLGTFLPNVQFCEDKV